MYDVTLRRFRATIFTVAKLQILLIVSLSLCLYP
jgi:hypothetical protein